MKKMAILLIALMVISVGFLSGCTDVLSDTLSSEEKKFIGTWKHTQEEYSVTIHFFSDGTYDSPLYFNDYGKFEVKDGRLVLSADDITVGTETYSYTFSDNDNSLSLGGGWEFKKQ